MAHEFHFDRIFVQHISNKVNLLDSKVQRTEKLLNINKFTPNSKKMISSMKKMMFDINSNLSYLNSPSIFQEDFFQAISLIDTAINTYITSLNSIESPKDNIISLLQKDIEKFSKSALIFISVFQEIITSHSNSKSTNQKENDQINLRLGIESVIFTFSVNVNPTTEYPFFKSNYIEIYQFYHQINNISDPIAAIESYCGTGKTLLIPMILLCRSLKDKMKVPFVILSQPSPKHVESKDLFFNKKLSKYVSIISDPNKLTETIKNYDENDENSKLILGLSSPYNLLPMLYDLRRNQNFYQQTRFIIDELSQRTIYFDVLLSKLGLLRNDFKLPLNVILMSASFSNEVLKPFGNQVKMISLIKHPLFEIRQRAPIIERNIYKINNVIVPNESVNVIKEMAKVNSSIEEGNILCFLSGIGNCNKLKKSIYSLLRNTKETEKERKIVILQTNLKPNETKENYFRRLQNEFELNEGLREGKNYRYDFLYFIPLVLSGIVEDTIYELSQEEFPGELKKINKFICSTPMLQSSFTIDKLSVVIDSGLAKEAGFDIFTGLTTLTEKQVSFEIMNQRKGRLGRTMNGLYVPICSPKYLIPQCQTSPIEKVDLTNYILYLKNVGIDIEKLRNLPSNPDSSILDFTMDNMTYVGAIDPKTNEITPFGREMLKYSFISIYYAASVLKFRDTFEKNDRPYANFIATYISLVIQMDSILVQEDNSEKLSRFFREDSDIVTLINALNSLILSKITDNNEKRDLVESYGFSYSTFLVFIENMQTITDMIFPGKTTADVIRSLGSFVKKLDGISSIIDRFILEVIKVYPHWKRIHSIEMRYVSGAGNFDSRPSLIFDASDRLKFPNQKKPNAEVRISSRPGWNGIVIPSECYCFNISRNMNSNFNIGRLVHRMSKKSKCCITSVECDKSALNPWFDVLLSSYFNDGYFLNIRYFKNVVKKKNPENKMEEITYEKRMFHISNVEGRVFVSFIPGDDHVKQIVVEGVKKCLLLMPFTPRSIVVLRTDVDSLVEIKSIGSQHYESSSLQSVCFQSLWKYNIEYCIENLKELAKSDSQIRIAALFINETCKLNEYDQKSLYLIIPVKYDFMDVSRYSVLYLKDIFKYYNKEPVEIPKVSSDPNQLELFQFPAKFIHPALMYNQESLDCIMKWFSNHCKYAHIVKVIGHRLLMKSSEILELQNHLRNEKEEIENQMNLKLTAIPVPKKIYQKAYLQIREHQTWIYNSRFKVIIASKSEEDEIKEFLQSFNDEKQTENKHEESNETLCCIYVCDDPDNPTLTNYPITVYYKDGTSYTNKMCRDCLYSSLEVATESFYSNGEINQEALEKITFKPSVIPSVNSKETEDGLECWPQIPLGQMISALIVNDDEMSSLVSAWLSGVVEYTLRTQSRHYFTFCPDHPHKLYNIKKFDKFNCFCTVPKCRNLFCSFCKSFHNENYICDEKKNGKPIDMTLMKCPKCLTPTIKDGGCNHITCPCGCHWCYKCGKGFPNPTKCYEHLSKVHGGCFDYNFD